MRSCENSEAIAQVDDAQLQKFTLSLCQPRSACGGCESPRVSMRAAGSEETAASNPFFGLEFDVELAQHTAVDVLPSGDAEAEPGCDGMSEVRKTRKGEWWQVHGWSAAVVRCAAFTPPAECVGCHGPEELRHQMLRGHALDERGSP